MNRWLSGLCLLVVTLSAQAEMEVIPLHYRSVEEMLPLIRPMLDADGVANGMDGKLVVRSSSGNIAQIRQLLQEFDRAPRRLNITVMQNVDGETIRRLTEASASVGAGRARISAGTVSDGKGVVLATGRSGDQASIHINSERQQQVEDKSQQIQVQEGKQALISTGQSYALPQRQIIQYPGHAQIIDSTQYRDVGSGFYVLPRVNGDRVSLEVSTQNDALQGGDDTNLPAVRTQHIQTTVYGRLGEWIVLGDVAQQSSEEGSTLSSQHSSSNQERRNVLLKVELLN